MKTIKNASCITRFVTGLLLLFSCFYMYDFYKCLSGFIANGFREPLVMLPMILAFLLPVLCFLAFFYDFYVRAIHPAVKIGYSVLVALYAIADLALIFNNLALYAGNHALGVYDALPSIVLHFPYDMIVVLLGLLAMQIFHLAAGESAAARALNGCKERGTLQIRVWEYLLLCVLAIVVFVFAGAAICATFTAFEKAFYDARYIFLLIWAGLIPMANLAVLTLKPENMVHRKPQKLGVLGSLIAANVLFGVAFLLLELTYPDFLVHIGKPVFLIAFSVSLPIEPGVILGIMLLGTVIAAVRMIWVAAKDKEVA